MELEARRIPLGKFVPVEDEELEDLFVNRAPYPTPPRTDEFAKFEGTFQDTFGASLKQRNKARYQEYSNVKALCCNLYKLAAYQF